MRAQCLGMVIVASLIAVTEQGGLLPGLLYHDQDTYSAEILAVLKGQKQCSTLAR